LGRLKRLIRKLLPKGKLDFNLFNQIIHPNHGSDYFITFAASQAIA
jgi:hypothetical protein